MTCWRKKQALSGKSFKIFCRPRRDPARGSAETRADPRASALVRRGAPAPRAGRIHARVPAASGAAQHALCSAHMRAFGIGRARNARAIRGPGRVHVVRWSSHAYALEPVRPRPQPRTIAPAFRAAGRRRDARRTRARSRSPMRALAREFALELAGPHASERGQRNAGNGGAFARVSRRGSSLLRPRATRARGFATSSPPAFQA